MNPRFDKQQSQPRYRVNEKIRFSPVMVISAEGETLGSMPVDKALQKARDVGLDLVEVAPQARPPVCRIMNFDKFRYEQSIKEKEKNQKQKSVQLKEIMLSPNIAEHDIEIKTNSIKKFLEEEHKVLLKLKFKGRAIVHQEIGLGIIKKILEAVKEVSMPQKTMPKMDGKTLVCMIEPINAEVAKRNQAKKAAPDAETGNVPAS